MRAFEGKHAELEARIRDLSNSGENLAREIGAAVVGMQFQDRVSQRLGHVIEALEECHSLANAPGANGALPATAMLRSMTNTYTMAEERDAHLRGSGASRAAPSASANSEVVLF